MIAAFLGSATEWLQPRPWAGVIAVLAALGGLLGGLALLHRLARPHPELLRKGVHVGMGLVTLTFPRLFDRPWPVWLLCAAAIGGLALVRTRRLRERGPGHVLHGVRRPSLGEVYFPISVAALFTLAGDRVILYVVPILLLTLADATAALIGLRYGSISVRTIGGRKTLEGCVAFFVVGYFAVHVPLLLGSDLDRGACLLIAVTIALLVMLLEFVSWRGLDNLFVPLGAFALLSVYVELTTVEILYRLFATIALLAFVIPWRHRTSLGPSALAAAALFGYFALMIGGWRCLIPPLALFLLPAVIWPRRERPAYHEAAVVASNVAVALGCLVLYAYDPGAGWLELYGLCFATHIGLVAAAFALTRLRPGTAGWWAGLAGCAALAVISAVSFTTLLTSTVGTARVAGPIAAVIAIAIAVPAFALARPRFFPLDAPPWRVHLATNLLVLAVIAAHAVSTPSILTSSGV